MLYIRIKHNDNAAESKANIHGSIVKCIFQWTYHSLLRYVKGWYGYCIWFAYGSLQQLSLWLICINIQPA